MLIQVNADNHIRASAELAAFVEPAVAGALSQYADRITRVEVYFKDANSNKGGALDKECTVEVRLAGLTPVAASGHAASLDVALDGALDKLLSAIEHAEGKAGKTRREGIGGD